MSVIEQIKLAEKSANEKRENAKNKAKKIIEVKEEEAREKASNILIKVKHDCNQIKAESEKIGQEEFDNIVHESKKHDDEALKSATASKGNAVDFVLSQILL
jgi:vacuolar-type H+-ATPase subunit H